MLSQSLAPWVAMLCVTVSAVPQVAPASNATGLASAGFVFEPPTLEPFIHIEIQNDYPRNTSTKLGLIGDVPIVGGTRVPWQSRRQDDQCG